MKNYFLLKLKNILVTFPLVRSSHNNSSQSHAEKLLKNLFPQLQEKQVL